MEDTSTVGKSGVYRKRLRVWVVVTLIQGLVLLSGILYTEYGLDSVGLYSSAFVAWVLFSLIVAVPLMLTTPVSFVFSVYYFVRLKRLSRRASQ